jgi:hypothetical protein
MATSRITFGAVLGTIGDAAGTVSTVLNTVTTSVSMLGKFVDDAKEQQRIRSIVNMDSFGEVLAEESAMAEATRKSDILAFCKKSPEHQELFNVGYNRVKALLAVPTK